jgi:hypothetical protein
MLNNNETQIPMDPHRPIGQQNQSPSTNSERHHFKFGRVLTADIESEPFRYSICVLVNKPDEYEAMCESFVRGGFSSDDTEFFCFDNSLCNGVDAYRAYNCFLNQATSSYIVLCHQDVLLLEDGRSKLDQNIRLLNELDPAWGLFGNAGKTADGGYVARVTDPRAKQRFGIVPARVISLDENFIVVRRSANLAVSHDLHGFHMYGTDLCLVAEILGWHAYVVDFHLLHKSAGTYDKALQDSKRRLRSKYLQAFRSRWVYLVTPGNIYITGSKLANHVSPFVHKLKFGLFNRVRSAWQRFKSR